MLPKERLAEIRTEIRTGLRLAHRYGATKLAERLVAKEEYRRAIYHGECAVHHETLLALALDEIGETKVVKAIRAAPYGEWAYYAVRGFRLRRLNAEKLVEHIASVGDQKWAYWALHDFLWISTIQETLLLHALTAL